MEYSLECLSCAATYASTYASQTCARCGSNLEINYKKTFRIKKASPTSLWQYLSALPRGRYKRWLAGGTKLIESKTDPGLFLKLEIENPTRSFKDRGSVIEISKAAEYGYNQIACASTGNMAFSLSYYAELAGIASTVFIGGTPNPDKLRYIRDTHDARIVRVKGDFNKALEQAYAYSKRNGAFLTGDYGYRKEGQKSMAYEIIDQLESVSHIIVPVGNSTLLSGIFKGLQEMKSSGRIKRLPKLIAVQASGCSPLYRAFVSGSDVTYQKPNTAADAIAVGYPTFGVQGLEALLETRGKAVAVTDNEMRREQESFLKEYGLHAELAGVASIVACRKLGLSAKDRAVAVISGGNV